MTPSSLVRRMATVCLGACALGAAQAQSSVSVYGLLDTGLTVVNTVTAAGASQPGRVVSVHPGAMQASRLGYRGVEDLGGGLKALFVLETGVNVDAGTFAQGGAGFGRRSVVGLEGGFGTVLVGRQPDFLDDMGAMSSAFTFGAQASTIHALDRTYTDRTNQSIRYTTPRFGGTRAVALIGFGENTATSHGQALGLGLDHSTGALRLAAGYYQSKLGAQAANGSQASIGAQAGSPGQVALRTYSLAATYQLGSTRLMAMFSDVRQPLAVATGARSLRSAANRRTTIWDLGVHHALSSALFLNMSVILDKADFVAASSGRVRQLNLGLDLLLSKRTDVYANAGHQSASRMLTPGMGEGAPGLDRSQTLMRVGVRHRF